MEVDVCDLDSLELGSAQTAGDTEGENTQIPAMNEQ
jgi:hypothetical protein